MGFEAETVKQKKSIAKLPLFSMPAMQTEKSGMMTPPLHASAAVPFRWEQVPGKPRPCSALITFSNNPNSFQLPPPPRLLIPSPYPYASNTNTNTNTNTFRSPSFRMLLTKPPRPGGVKDYAWFASWRRKTFTLKKRDQVTGASHVFPSSSTHNKDDTHFPKIKRSGTSTIWTSVCEGFKHVVPWKSKKLKKHGTDLWF